MEFMSMEQQGAFVDAFEALYGIELSATPKENILNGTVHHGKSFCCSSCKMISFLIYFSLITCALFPYCTRITDIYHAKQVCMQEQAIHSLGMHSTQMRTLEY